MKSILTLITAAAIAALSIASTSARVVASPALVAQVNACHVSLTGTVTQVVSASEFAMEVDNHHVGSIHVFDNGARMNAHGLSLAPGTYVGAYGCFQNGNRTFKANEVTLAPSQAAYRGTVAANTPPAPAPGMQVGPCHVSLFGTITQVWNNGVEVTLQTTGPIGSIHVYYNEALMHTNGLSIRNGVYAGVYGCFLNHEERFHANEVTLATSAATYPTHPTVVATGVIDDIARGWIGVRTRYYGHVHVLTNQTGFSRGERVSIEGHYNTVTRQIDATRVTPI